MQNFFWNGYYCIDNRLRNILTDVQGKNPQMAFYFLCCSYFVRGAELKQEHQLCSHVLLKLATLHLDLTPSNNYYENSKILLTHPLCTLNFLSTDSRCRKSVLPERICTCLMYWRQLRFASANSWNKKLQRDLRVIQPKRQVNRWTLPWWGQVKMIFCSNWRYLMIGTFHWSIIILVAR